MTKKSIYSPEFKTQAISLVREARSSGSEIAKELGISVNTLYNCLSLASGKLIKKHTNVDILSENKRLKKELAQAELERDILKKAAAYFVREIL